MARLRHRGLTLAELAVSVAVFGLVLVALVAVARIATSARNQETLQQTSFRGAMLALEHLKRELATATLEEISPDRTSLTIREPQFDAQGRARVGPTGDLIWSTPVRIFMDGGGRLIREQDGQQRLLSRLGEGGLLEMEQLDRQLRVHLRARASDGQGHVSESELEVRLPLVN